MTRMRGEIRDDERSATPVQTTLLIAIVILVGLLVGAAVFDIGYLLGEPTTVPAGSGECSYTIDFDPRDVSGFAEDRAASQRYVDGTFPCVLWFDASSSRSGEPGSSVRTWRDKSSNGFDAKPVGTAPRWASVDGIEAVEFGREDNASLTVDATPADLNVSTDSGLTVTMLVYVVDAEDRGGGLYSMGDPGGGPDGRAFEVRQSDVSTSDPAADEWWADPGPDAEITTDGEWAIVTHTTDGEEGTLYVNGESVGTETGRATELGGEIRIGSVGPDSAFEGYVAEYFVTNERLGEASRNIVQCAMAENHDDVVDLDVC
ncbi:MAG: LamG-like jellyroll fold domain-containing protein [Halohasta sp.]